MRIATFGIITFTTLLGACGGGGGSSSSATPTTGGGTPSGLPDNGSNGTIGTAQLLSSGEYEIVQNGQSTTLPANPDQTPGSDPVVGWFDLAMQLAANAYQGTDVLATGGVSGTEYFSGITGIVTEQPTGNARYEGRFIVVRDGRPVGGPVNLDYDFATSKIENDGGNLTVDGTASDSIITGTVTHQGDSADFAGGFYGTDEVAGAFNSDTIGGIFYGTENTP